MKMNDVLPWILMAALTGSWLLERENRAAPETPAPTQTAEARMLAPADLQARLARSGHAYLPVLDEATLRAGLYMLPAGGEDLQEPHDREKVYYVLEGRSKVTVGGRTHDVQPGAVLYVPAHTPHRFHDIEAALQLLMFFSEAPPEATAD